MERAIVFSQKTLQQPVPYEALPLKTTHFRSLAGKKYKVRGEECVISFLFSVVAPAPL